MSKNVIYMQEALREIKEIKNKIAALKLTGQSRQESEKTDTKQYRFFQTVDKVQSFCSGLFSYLCKKSQYFKDFKAFFWYNISIKYRSENAYDDTEC